MNSYQTEYLDVWKTSFSIVLGWTEEQTVSWAQPLLAGMRPPGMVINEPPLYYVARELAWRQQYYNELSQRDRHEFIRAIQNILSPNHERSLAADFASAAARAQLAELIRDWKPKNQC